MNDHHKNISIELKNISKIYKSYSTPQQRLLEILSSGRKKYAKEIKALSDVNISLNRGDRLGIVGENGSGKSTLLKIVAGVLTPTSGNVKVHGRISALLELGTGFSPDLTGIENIKQFCMIHSMSDEETENALLEIIEFSELNDFINQPIRTYSSGMVMRLGFACAVYIKPEILIVDEALSVGDSYFQNKCLHKIKSMLDDGVTFIYVTHGSDAIRALCTKGLWLDKGKVKLTGMSEDVGQAYDSEMFSRLVRSENGFESENSSIKLENEKLVERVERNSKKRQEFSTRVAPFRTGSGEIRITEICILNRELYEVDKVRLDDFVSVRVYLEGYTTLNDNAALSLGVTDSFGRQILHFNSSVKNVFASGIGVGKEYYIEFEFKNVLCPGEYGLVAGIGTLEFHPEVNGLTIPSKVIDYCAGGSRFTVLSPTERDCSLDLWGLVNIEYSVSKCEAGN